MAEGGGSSVGGSSVGGSEAAALPEDLRLVQRGWLHGNVLVARGPEPGLLDTGYHSGVAELGAEIRRHLGQGPEAITQILLTHAHSDHAGGVAAFQQGAFAGAAPEVQAHADLAAMTEPWDPVALWLEDTGQELPRFTVDEVLEHDDTVVFGGRRWRCVHTPGHATGGLSFHCEAEGLLVTGDALWEDGFGLLNPWIDGWAVLDHTALTLDRLADCGRRGVRVVVPGHGGPFTDLDGALARARSRLAYLRANPDRMAVQLARNCLGFLRLARPELGRAELEVLVAAQARRTGLPLAEQEALLDALP